MALNLSGSEKVTKSRDQTSITSQDCIFKCEDSSVEYCLKMLTGRYLTRHTTVRRTVIRVPRRLRLVVLLLSVVARDNVKSFI